MCIRRIFIVAIVIFLSSYIVVAQDYTSPNYTLTKARIVASSGKANSPTFSLNNVRIGNILGGKAESANYSLDARNIEKRTPPNPPTLNPVITPTNLTLQTLSGTKDKYTSIYINGYEVVPLDSEISWSYEKTLTEGDNHLIITARNKYGLESESVYVTITLDTIPPSPPILNPVTTPTNISTQTISGTKEADTSIWINGLQSLALNSPTSFSTDVSLSEGENTFNITAKDTALNESQPSIATIILDTIPPTGTIRINNDAPYTNSLEVSLNLLSEDNTGGSGIDKMQFSHDNINFSSPESYAPSKTWTLTEGDGEKKVFVKFEDKAGNTSLAYQDAIILDTTPPQIIITSPKEGAIVDTEEIVLEGTVDGTGFSEVRTLPNQGENILTKTAQDEAGNVSSASVTVYYYPGTPIGPEGGEVVSFDGKVKVIIPAGALSESTYISLLPLDKASLQEAAPEDHTLLSIVECKPYGLNFNKPIQLIYTLDEAEVPGTPVGLGFYDSLQDKINLTGIDSVIASDGYTVNFTISHFSTYATLKNLLPTKGAPIGSGVEIPLPDIFTGAFSHSYPLTLPPARLGMQPNLALVYRSSNPNSWTGLGFSLNPGYIVRSTRLGPPTYIDEEDTFYFVNPQGTTELAHLVDNLYQAKIESGFTKFFKEAGDFWRVVSKEGAVLIFGQTDNSREISTQGTFSWYLTKAVDSNGNYIEYNYTKNEGKCYLSSIDYTGNEKTALSPRHKIEFFLEPREDTFSSYLSTSKIATTKRLSEIHVKLNDDLVWRYKLEYEYSPDTHRSLLKSITQYAADGKSFPTQSFSYQQAEE